MTTTQAFELFDILQDKYASPYIHVSWKVRLINQAQYQYLNQLFPDSQGGVINFDHDSNVFHNVKPLIYVLSGLATSAQGVLTNSTINTALQTASSQGTTTVFRIGNVGKDNTPVRYIKQNNIFSFKNNIFKRPTAANPRFKLTAPGLQFYPEQTFTGLTVEVIKNPREISETVDPEWDDYVVYNLIAKMLVLTGVSTREEQLSAEARVLAAGQ